MGRLTARKGRLVGRVLLSGAFFAACSLAAAVWFLNSGVLLSRSDATDILGKGAHVKCNCVRHYAGDCSSPIPMNCYSVEDCEGCGNTYIGLKCKAYTDPDPNGDCIDDTPLPCWEKIWKEECSLVVGNDMPTCNGAPHSRPYTTCNPDAPRCLENT